LARVQAWYLYLIRCGDGSIYTGVATDVSRRLAEHRGGKGARYLRGRGPLLLARKVRVGAKSDAFKMEWRVKRLSRGKKEKLIARKIKLKDLVSEFPSVSKKGKGKSEG
jgi:putative endonuclease